LIGAGLGSSLASKMLSPPTINLNPEMQKAVQNAEVYGRNAPTKLVGKNAGELLRDAIKHVNETPGSTANKVKTLKDLLEQVKTVQKGWEYSSFSGTDGGTTFVGGFGFTVTIRPDGKIFTGEKNTFYAGKAFSPQPGLILEVNYDYLKLDNSKHLSNNKR
jgi:hypothetical protein